MKPPSTQWRETVGADEAARFGAYAKQLVEIQRRNHARSGPGRALHRKQHLGLAAQLEVLGDLPAHARHGLFATPGRLEAQIRLSNGSSDRGPDRRPDVRGFGIRVVGVTGPGALGGTTPVQCFALINSATFAFGNVDDFMGIVVAASHGQLAVVRHLIKRHGVLGGFGQVRQLAKALGKPFAGFACETFHSAAPIACGPYAAKVRLVPHNGEAERKKPREWASDVVARLANGELRWDLQLQFFVAEDVTPIERPEVLWPEAEAPFVTVARLVAPGQDPHSPDGAKLAEAIEAGKLDPWNALADHRPLGEIMRARKDAYFASQKERGAV